jgi:hypothetical protein
MTSFLALALLASPASAWFAPDRYSGLPSWAEAPGLIPQWFAWTANWATINKWVTTMWPDSPKFKSVSEGARIRLMPPLEYDHPFRGNGKLVITQAASEDEVRKLCPGAAWPKVGAFGCAMTKVWGCHVVIRFRCRRQAGGANQEHSHPPRDRALQRLARGSSRRAAGRGLGAYDPLRGCSAQNATPAICRSTAQVAPVRTSNPQTV